MTRSLERTTRGQETGPLPSPQPIVRISLWWWAPSKAAEAITEERFVIQRPASPARISAFPLLAFGDSGSTVKESVRSASADVAMIAGLLKSQVSIGEPDARRLQEILGNYPESVREAARPLLARLEGVSY